MGWGTAAACRACPISRPPPLCLPDAASAGAPPSSPWSMCAFCALISFFSFCSTGGSGARVAAKMGSGALAAAAGGGAGGGSWRWPRQLLPALQDAPYN